MEPPVLIVYKTQAPRAPRHKTPHPTELSLEAPVVPLTKAPVPPPTKAPIVDITVSPTLAPSFPPKVVPVSTEPGTDDHVEGEDALPGYQPPNAEKGLPEPVSGDDLALQEEGVRRFSAESPALQAITQRLRAAFDPHGTFNPGRVLAASPMLAQHLRERARSTTLAQDWSQIVGQVESIWEQLLSQRGGAPALVSLGALRGWA